MKLFISTVIAHRKNANGSVDISSYPSLFTAANRDEAVGLLWQEGRERLSTVEGWCNHSIVVNEVSAEKRAEILAALQAIAAEGGESNGLA